MYLVFNNSQYKGSVLNLQEAKQRNSKSEKSVYVWQQYKTAEGKLVWKLECKNKEGKDTRDKTLKLVNWYSADVANVNKK